jgi:hypothetical protein
MASTDDFRDDMARSRQRKSQATAKGGQAYLRLLQLAETQTSGQARRIAHFLAATYDGAAFPLDLFELRAVDEAVSDDMLLCLDALRWGQAELHTLVPDGDRRVTAVIELWGLKWPGSL